jgi:hypothetical protein
MQDFRNVVEANFRGEWRGHQVSHRFKYRQYKCTCGAQRQDHGQFVAFIVYAIACLFTNSSTLGETLAHLLRRRVLFLPTRTPRYFNTW